jgi:hypothetical protein
VHALIYHHDNHFVVWLPDAPAEPIEWPHEQARVTAMVVAPTGEGATARRWAPQRVLPELIGEPLALPKTPGGTQFLPTTLRPDVHNTLYSAPRSRVPEQLQLQAPPKQPGAIAMSDEEIRCADATFGANTWRLPSSAIFIKPWLEERRRSETLARQATVDVGQASEQAHQAHAQLEEIKRQKAALVTEIRELDAKLADTEGACRKAEAEG